MATQDRVINQHVGSGVDHMLDVDGTDIEDRHDAAHFGRDVTAVSTQHTTLRPPTSLMAEVLAALPEAVDSLALSLNENPFPPLPAVRSALIEAIDAANRYPEFLPERLRALIAGRIGMGDEQVVLGAGATGVVLQVLHAVTTPGDRIVLASPTFDGYPIMARMARLEPVTVALDEHGHHDLDAMADAAADAKVVVLCRPHNPTGTLEPTDEVRRFLQRVPPDTVVLLDEAYIEFVRHKRSSMFGDLDTEM